MRGIRKSLVLASAAGLIAAASGWVGLKVGRPLYYSDGDEAINSLEMRESGMLRWSRPEFDGDIPGPVRGRVIELPDGTLLYGLGRSSAVTDLVQFDPRRPGAEPRPVVELNSEGHDLAPVLTPGGNLFFASDRLTGAGGFDVYRATYRDGVFFAVRSLPGGVNTGLDETDPAVDGPGGQLVFVRRDPELHDGSNGRLMAATLGLLEEAKLLLPETEAEKRAAARSSRPSYIDRDPFFAADAVGVYFVRETVDRGVALMRTFWHRDGYVDPVEVSNLQDGGPFRGPVLLADGFGMRLVTTQEPARMYRAQAKEVYPYWQGQFWLEWLLLSFILFFALLLILLVLGARWKQLDTLTKLLLLSMLIHLLLILWLAGMEIVRRYDPRGPGDGELEVRLVAQGSMQGASGSTRDEIQQSLRDVSRDLSFEGREEALDFARPGTEVEATESALTNAAATRPSYTPAMTTQEVTLGDEAADLALRNGVDEQRAPDRRQLTTSADLSDRTQVERGGAAVDQLTVTVPGSASRLVDRVARSLPSVEQRELPPATSTRQEAVQVQDAAVALQRRANGPEVSGAETSLRRTVGAPGQTSAAATTAVRSQSSEAALGSRPPTSDIAREVTRRDAGPVSERTGLHPGSAVAEVVKLDDALQVGASRRAIAEAGAPPTTRSESGRAQKSEQGVEVARAVQGQVSAVEVGRPRSDLADQSVRRLSEAVRTLPERDSAAQMQVAVVDDALGTATGRAQATEQVQKIAAVDLGLVTNSSSATQAQRAELNGSDREAVAPPTSDLGRSQARRTVAARRSDPRQRDTGASVQALLADGMNLDTQTTSQATALEDSRRIAAAELKRLERSDASNAERAKRVGDVGQRILLTPPGSSIARDTRRKPLVASVERDSTSSRDLSMVQALDDAVGSAGGASAVGAPLSVARTLRPVRAVLPQNAAAGVDRPSRHLGGVGQDMATVGIRVPGSFLERAEARGDVAIAEVAKAELTPYSNRFGEKKLAALRKFGGDAQTERAVESGLAYLARIQNRDGSWGDRQFMQEKYGRAFVGKTALCLLAFLGAGHTPDSGTEYSEVTSRAIDALLRSQRSSAHFGVSSSYGHGITTYALAECYALTKDPKLREPLLAAVSWILTNQSRSRDRRNRGGWGYFSSTMEPEDGYSRTSTSAWQVMALESAKLSGMEVPDESLVRAREFLLNNYDRRNRYFLYNHEPERLRSEWPTLPASTPAAVFCLQLLGMDASDERLAGGLEFTLNRRPQSYRQYSDDDFVLLGAGNVYFWYYGSLACFMAGGEIWDSWNAALKRVLLAGQSRDGSFRPIDAYAEYAGDSDRDMSYTTAMCVLSLEVYYRYFTPLLRDK